PRWRAVLARRPPRPGNAGRPLSPGTRHSTAIARLGSDRPLSESPGMAADAGQGSGRADPRFAPNWPDAPGGSSFFGSSRSGWFLGCGTGAARNDRADLPELWAART